MNDNFTLHTVINISLAQKKLIKNSQTLLAIRYCKSSNKKCLCECVFVQ